MPNRHSLLFRAFLVLIFFSVFWAETSGDELPLIPLPTGQSLKHSHNDYARNRPLLEALDSEFDGIEADIFLVNGQLLVGHTTSELRSDRTLSSMYLDPLRQRVDENQGSVYSKNRKPLVLLIDIKSDGPETFHALHELLVHYSSLLTRIENGKILRGAITIVVSGNRPVDLIKSAEPRLAFVDGRLKDLESGKADPLVYPMISDQWSAHFAWQGTGEVPAADCDKLRQISERAQKNGSALRFWGVPDTRAAWELLWDHGVDMIGTDQPSELAKFMAEKTSHRSSNAQGDNPK